MIHPSYPLTMFAPFSTSVHLSSLSFAAPSAPAIASHVALTSSFHSSFLPSLLPLSPLYHKSSYLWCCYSRKAATIVIAAAAMHPSQSIDKRKYWRSSQCLGPPETGSESWDRKAFAGAVVVRLPENEGGKPYRMYYYGRGGDLWNMGVTPFNATLPTGRIGMALSEDGVIFERFGGPLEGGAVMDPSSDPEAFDCVHIAVGDAVFSAEQKRWSLYYFGGNLEELPLVGFTDRRCKGVLMQPGVAFSEDGINFKEREGPILRVGEPGSWDQNGVSWPRVLAPQTGDRNNEAMGTKWLMSYHTRESGGPNGYGFFSAGIAVSDDGRKWEKRGKILSCGAPGTWDEGGVSVRHVIRHAGKYLMAYEGSNYKFEFSIGLAVSDDGLLWKKDTECGPEPGGPVLKARKGEDVWDNLVVGTPYVIAMPDGSLRMYYLGVGKREAEAVTKQGIGLAVSDGKDFRVWKSDAPGYILCSEYNQPVYG